MMAAVPDENSADHDAVLLQRFAAGDQSAARALTDRLLPGALRQAWRILGDQIEAEDVAQDAMLRLWKQAPDWRQCPPAEGKQGKFLNAAEALKRAAGL